MAELMTRPFLTSYEMFGGAGADAETARNKAFMSNMEVGAAAGQSINSFRKGAEAAERMDQMGTIAKALYIPPTNVEQPAPQAQPAPQVQASSPVPQAQPAMSLPAPTQQAAPAQMPVQAAPALPAPVQPAPVEQPAMQAPVQVAPVTQAAPVQMPAQSAPSQPAQGQAPLMPPTKASPPEDPVEATRQRILSSPVLGGKINPYSDEVYGKRRAALDQLVQTGKVKPQYAAEYVAQMDVAREKAFERAAEFEKKVGEIASKDTDTRKKAVEIRAESRKLEDNNFHDVYQIFKSGDLAGAKAAALERGLVFDPANPKSVVELETRAKRSGDYTAAQEEARKASKEAREAAKADRVDWKRDETTGLSAGVDPVSGNIIYKDESGKTYTSAEYRKMSTDQKAAIARAGRAISGGGGGGGGSGQVSAAGVTPGGISGLKRDKQGNITVDTGIVKQLAPAAKAFGSGTRVLGEMDTIEKDGVLDAAPASGIGGAIAGAQKLVGYGGDLRIAQERIDRFANSALGIIESPLMKGAPSEADARRALSVITAGTNSTPQAKKEAIASLKTAIEEARRSYTEAVGQYDAPTRARLKGLGIDVPGEAGGETAPAKAPAKAEGQIIRSQAQYDALPAGASYIGPDGKKYVKKG